MKHALLALSFSLSLALASGCTNPCKSCGAATACQNPPVGANSAGGCDVKDRNTDNESCECQLASVTVTTGQYEPCLDASGKTGCANCGALNPPCMICRTQTLGTTNNCSVSHDVLGNTYCAGGCSYDMPPNPA